MIRSNDWKLLLGSRIDSEQMDMELYNLETDPEEQKNLFAEEVEIGKSLFAELQNWMDSQEEKSKVTSTDNKVQLDKELTDQLKALGYIN
ncbi:MAG: hypothetical protein HYW01_09405 [Deltaproteobacteria bacterium]|nr:hypothetical protein [Deltaproteobacteria bacterium]